ncbi:MAG: hypothetical protein JXQ73_09575, partial [Phycisphaerae bacterium]|nr:hypothetical protein [Phycisphaerae bacterium]
RFTSRDSIGIWGDEGNLGNAFAYVGSNPWTRLDPSGRHPIVWYFLGGFALGVAINYYVHGSDYSQWDGWLVFELTLSAGGTQILGCAGAFFLGGPGRAAGIVAGGFGSWWLINGEHGTWETGDYPADPMTPDLSKFPDPNPPPDLWPPGWPDLTPPQYDPELPKLTDPGFDVK